MTLVAVQLETSFLLLTTSVLIPLNTTRVRMDLQVPLRIHEVLPGEIMAIIFEEHAKLKWRAPAIDGRVCRVWRQIVLNAPRAWSYLKIGFCKFRISDLLLWLARSRTAPLHITVCDSHILSNIWGLYEPLSTRIVSLRILRNNPSFFDGRDFPCMQHLDIKHSIVGFRSSPVSCGHMPNLRSLRLGPYVHAVSLDGLAPLKMLVLCDGKITSLSQHFSSLVSLTLETVELRDAISGSVDFPSLTYLSLYEMSHLTPHINAPCLITYHQCSSNPRKSFTAPLHSLVEYGLLSLGSYRLDLAEWHSFFPNISRLSIRTEARHLISFLGSLSIHPHLLPALQIISVWCFRGNSARITKQEQQTMKDLVQVRSVACHLDVALYFETEQPFQIPLFFGVRVSNPPDDLWLSDAHTRALLERWLSADFTSACVMQSTPQNKEGTLAFVLVIWIFYY